MEHLMKMFFVVKQLYNTNNIFFTISFSLLHDISSHDPAESFFIVCQFTADWGTYAICTVH